MSKGNKNSKARILIADDHAIFRERLKKVISEIPDVMVFGEAGRGNEVLEFVNKNVIDLVILDIGLPDRNGIEILKELKIKKPDIPVLILSMFSAKQFAASALKAGASGYVTKENMLDELIEAITQILRGKTYFTSFEC